MNQLIAAPVSMKYKILDIESSNDLSPSTASDAPMINEALAEPMNMMVSAISLSYGPPIRSDLCHAAIHEQFNTSDKAGIGRSEEDDSLGQFIWLSKTPHYNGRSEGLHLVRV